MKRAAPILLFFCSLIAGGCGGGGAPSRQPSTGPSGIRDELHLAQTTEPTTLDPAQVQDGPTIELLMSVYDGLVQWTPENRLAPALAESWKVSDGGTTYTFKIRPNVQFHDGKKLSAEDFVYSIRRSLQPETASPVAMVYLNDLVGAAAFNSGKSSELPGAAAPDPDTLVLKIDRPKAYFLSKLTYPTAYAVHREAIEKTGGMVNAESMIGAGPFRLEAYRRGSELVLQANASYWEGAPKLRRITRHIVLDADTRHSMFEAGELDIADISMAAYRADKENPALAPLIKQFKRPSIYYMALNQNAYAPFRDRRVRQAFAHAVNKEQIIAAVHEGVPPVAQGIIPHGVPGFDAEFKGLPFDPERARQLLAEAGYAGASSLPPLKLYFRASVEDIRGTAVAAAADLKKHLGVEITLEETEWATFLKKRNSAEMGLYFLRWAADYLDPQNFLSLMLHSRAPENSLGYRNAEFDRLCDQADLLQDLPERIKLYRQAQKIAVEDVPWIPLYYQVDAELWNPKLRGVEDSAMGHLPHKRTHFVD